MSSRSVGSAYLIEDVAAGVLGRGGTGTVYRAISRANGQPVAVKVLDESRLADPEVVTRFVRERDTLVRLRHPGLVPVIDLVVEGNLLAVVMELVDGPDLRTQLDVSGPLSPAAAAQLIVDMLPALGVAHASGVIHRDIKPENLLVERATGKLRITDFGIARLTLGSSITRLTSILGTPDYMAPELAEHELASPASDLYAVGILLYELVAGRRPFTGGHPVSVLRKHLDEAPERLEGMPDGLWAIVSDLLAKKPEDRPASTTETAARLQAFLGSDGAATTVAALPAPPLAQGGALPTTVGSSSTPAVQVDSGRPVEAWPAAAPAATPAATPAAAAVEGAEAALPRSTGSSREETVFGAVPRQPAPPVPQPAASRPKWLVPVAAAAAAVLALGAVGTIALRGKETPAAAASSTAVQNVFAVQPIGDGVVLTRTWTMTGIGYNHLRSDLEIVNGSKQVRRGHLDDVVPKGIATDASLIKMLTRGEVVVKDPVLRFGYALPPGERVIKSWELDLSVRSATEAIARKRLDGWAKQQLTDSAAYQALVLQRQAQQVIRLKLLPGSLSMPANGRAYVALSGRLANGQLASHALLSATTYESSNPGIVFVDRGLLTAMHAGTARVVARLGRVTASVLVRVTPATAAAPPVVAAPVAPGFTNTATLPQQPQAAPTVRPRPTPRPSPTSGTAGSPRPVPRPTPKPTPKPSPRDALIGKTYTAKVGSDAFTTSGPWTRYSPGGVAAARTSTAPTGCSGSKNVGPATAYWNMNVVVAGGSWDVQVFVPSDGYNANRAKYRVAVAGGGYVVKAIAQTSYRGKWVTIAHAKMPSAAEVRLQNFDGYAGDCSKVQPLSAASVRWIYRG